MILISLTRLSRKHQHDSGKHQGMASGEPSRVHVPGVEVKTGSPCLSMRDLNATSVAFIKRRAAASMATLYSSYGIGRTGHSEKRLLSSPGKICRWLSLAVPNRHKRQPGETGKVRRGRIERPNLA